MGSRAVLAPECSLSSAANPEAAFEVYRYRVIQNAVREHEICTAFRLLRALSIEPILLKGWSVARHYPDPGMRTLGDTDLLVRDEDASLAVNALSGQELNVDWHKLSGLQAEFATPDEVAGRSELVPLLDTHIRVLCPEDGLHFVAIHMLRHGGWLARWVRDVAVLLESRQANFDWTECLGSCPTKAGWVLSALVLAHQLAGADIRGTPAENHRIPEWLVSAVRKAQTDPDPAHHQPPESIWTALAHPWRLPHGIWKRWPNPITAAILTGRSFDRQSPPVHQLRYCAELTGGFFRRACR